LRNGAGIGSDIKNWAWQISLNSIIKKLAQRIRRIGGFFKKARKEDAKAAGQQTDLKWQQEQLPAKVPGNGKNGRGGNWRKGGKATSEKTGPSENQPGKLAANGTKQILEKAITGSRN